MEKEILFHITLLSNFARAYDKYSRLYDKSYIPESRYSEQFFLLTRNELHIGIAKTQLLLIKTNLNGDKILAIQTSAESSKLLENDRTGLGRYIESSSIVVEFLYYIEGDGTLVPVRIEDAYASSFLILGPKLKPYSNILPRSVSILPISIGCQAACSFCFSKASVSTDQTTRPIDMARVRFVLNQAKKMGATRAVITGGGEPGLVRFDRLLELVHECNQIIPKVVLITNGYFLQELSENKRGDSLTQLATAGLSVLSVSCHHHNDEINSKIMKLNTHPDHIAATISANSNRMNKLKMRLICVLQDGGIDSVESIKNYLDWSVQQGVYEICFKELYVSTSQESVYHNYTANEWSYQHQIPLKLILDFAQQQNWPIIERLPWGAPIYQANWKGHIIKVAAYTEPSLFWERSQGIARSWNLMADGNCLASLEDRNSTVC